MSESIRNGNLVECRIDGAQRVVTDGGETVWLKGPQIVPGGRVGDRVIVSYERGPGWAYDIGKKQEEVDE